MAAARTQRTRHTVWSGEPTCPPAPRSVRILYISIRIYWSTTPTHHQPRVQKTPKPSEHTDPGSAAPLPTPSQSNLLLEINTHRQVAPVSDGPTCQSVQASVTVSREEQGWMGTSTNQWQQAAASVTGKKFRNERCHSAREEIAGERAELSRQAVVAERKHPRPRSRSCPPPFSREETKGSNGEGGAGSEAAHQHGGPSLLVGHGA